MTNTATMRIYGKNLKNLLWSQKANDLESWYVNRVLEYYQVCSNDDPGLTLTYFTAWSNLDPYALVWERDKIIAISDTTVVYDVKVGRCSQLNEYMNLYEYHSSRSVIDLGSRSLRFNIFKPLFLRNC